MFRSVNLTRKPSRRLGPIFAAAPFCIAALLAASAAAQTAHLSAATTQNFGSVNVGTASSPATLTFTFDTAGTLGSTKVVTRGATGLDFADAGTGSCKAGKNYAAGATCTVNVILTPKFAGARYGAALLNTSGGVPFATAYLQGIGSGPQINFLPGVQTIPFGLEVPDGVAVDGAEEVYLSGFYGSVFKETFSGGSYIQSLIASGFTPPLSIAVDGSGSVYIAELNDSLILKETPTANGSYIQSVLATTPGTPSEVAIDGQGNVYVADQDGGAEVETLQPDGSYIQSAITQSGSPTWGIAVDGAGDIYLADPLNGVLKETRHPDGTYTETTIGTGLESPFQVTVDANGYVYIATLTSNQIVRESPSAGGYVQSTFQVDGLDSLATMNVDGRGNLFIVDAGAGDIIKENYGEPPKLTFATTLQGKTSTDSPQTVIVENAGNAPLAFPAPASGTNPTISANFTWQTSGAGDCPLVNSGASSATLAVGASCLLPISFTPASTGTLAGALVLTDNNLNALALPNGTQSISLSGIVGPPATQTTIQVSATSVQQPQPITLTATVTGPANEGTPTGIVTLLGLGTPAPTSPLNGSGVATLIISTLAPGHYTPAASYGGDSTHAPSTSQQGVFDVIGPPYRIIDEYSDPAQGSGTTYGSITYLLYVIVVDSFGHNLPGVPITFSGAGIQFNPASTVSTAGTFNFIKLTPLQAGSLVATASAAGVSTPVTYAFTVPTAPLTVTVAGNWRNYGAANPSFINSIHQLFNGDTVTVTDLTNAIPSSPLGSYPVTATVSGPNAGNYGPITIIPATLRVLPAPLTLIAKSEGVVYGQTPAQPTGYYFNGFVNGDNASVVSGAPVLTTNVTSTTPRGSYPIGVAVGTLSAANYKISAIGPQAGSGAVRVTKAPLTVTANTVTMTKGGAVPPLTYTITGFVNSEDASVVTGAPLLNTAATSSSPLGEYPITVNVGPMSAENYYFVPAVHGGVVKVSP